MLTFLRIVLTPLALVAIVASAMFAWAFGWSKGATPTMQYAFAVLLCGLDVSKAFMPLMASWAAEAGDRAKARVIWGCFAFLTLASIWAAWGVNAIQLNERQSAKVGIETQVKDAERKIERLKKARQQIQAFEVATDASVQAADAGVKAAESAVQAAVARVAEECGLVRGGRGSVCKQRETEERQAREALQVAVAAMGRVVAQKDATDQARKLDRQIEAAEAELAAIDRTAGAKASDPQAASIAKATGISEEKVSLISFIIASILVEIGSGLLPWMLFGHGGRRVEPQPQSALAPATPATVEVAPVVRPAFTEIETPDDTRTKFFRDCTFPQSGSKVSGTAMYDAYRKFCDEQGVEPLHISAFGRAPPEGVKKQKLNGTMYYLGVCLAPGYTVTPPVLRVVASRA